MSKYRFINEIIDGKKTHCHTLGGAPLLGTSSVVGVLAKPLTWWASGLAVAELGWTNPKFTDKVARLETAHTWRSEIVGMDDEAYLALLDKAYRAHSVKLDKSADSGTDMHSELEKYVKDCLAKNNGLPSIYEGEVPQVEIFCKWALENVEKFIVSEGYTYSEKLWLGGIVDCVAVLKNGKRAIIDFKSSKEAYVSQFLQVCLYDLQISENGIFDSDGNSMFLPMKADEYIIFPFGATKVEPSVCSVSDELKQGAGACVTLYKLTNKKDD